MSSFVGPRAPEGKEFPELFELLAVQADAAGALAVISKRHPDVFLRVLTRLRGFPIGPESLRCLLRSLLMRELPPRVVALDELELAGQLPWTLLAVLLA